MLVQKERLNLSPSQLDEVLVRGVQVGQLINGYGTPVMMLMYVKNLAKWQMQIPTRFQIKARKRGAPQLGSLRFWKSFSWKFRRVEEDS